MQARAKLRAGFQRIFETIKANRFQSKLMPFFEWPVFILVMLLSLFGVVAIFSAMSIPPDGQTAYSFMEIVRMQPTYYAMSQVQWIGIGLVAFAAMIYLDYRLFARFASLLYWMNIGILIFLLGMGYLGGASGGFLRWFEWGESRTFQPSELGKLVIIIALAQLFAARKTPVHTVSSFVRISLFVGVPLVLIAIQPDVGTALSYVVIYAALLFVSGTDRKLLTGILSVAIVVLVVGWIFYSTGGGGFRMDRIRVWLDPEFDIQGAGMQTYRARIAVGSGGLWGKGMFSPGMFATLKYIPAIHTDFIFASIAETFGYVGAGALVLMYLLLLLRLVALARRVEDPFGCYLVVGVTAMMLFHVFENIAMVIGLMPVTGIPLPFVSYGGSSYLTNILGIGLVINVVMRDRALRAVAGKANTPESLS